MHYYKREGSRTKETSKRKYMEGLDKRRYDEAEMYLYGDYKRDDDLSLDNPCSRVSE